MALNGLFCADVPLRNYSLTHSPGILLAHNSGQLKHCEKFFPQVWSENSVFIIATL